MGMFDYLKVETPLPDGYEAPEFQTKDFDWPYMDQYTITKEGRLIAHRVRREVVPKEERPYPNDDGLRGLCGSIRSIPLGEEDLNFHGWLNFYDLGPDKMFREYNAKFTEGQLVEIVKVADAA